MLMAIMEICCSFQSIVGGQCTFDRKDRKGGTQVIPLLSYKKDISGHLSTYKFSGSKNEMDLILCRAGLSNATVNIESMTICPSHRSNLGIGWSRGSTIKCRVPQSMSGHGRGKTAKWPKAERGIGKRESAYILKETGIFISVGSGMCKVVFYTVYDTRVLAALMHIIDLLSNDVLHNCRYLY